MPRVPYFVVDAFASRVFAGNPAGVCVLEEWFPDAVMQSIASENNLSETAFIVAEEGDYQLRWFTPTQEVPLCGHATLAAGFIVLTRLRSDRTEARFSTLSGPLAVRKDGTWLELDLPRCDALAVDDVPPALQTGLGIQTGEVLRTDGDTNYLVIVGDEAIVREVQPRLDALASLHPFGVAVSASGREADFVSRYFAPSYGIPEDPVTGSIHAALAPYWSGRLGRTTLSAMQLSPRGGELRCRVLPDRVMAAGRAVQYLEGFIDVG